MIDLIRKRHSPPGWIVIPECGNGTGYNVKRHADAIAMSIWPSRGYEIHGFEVKASRGDLVRELDDPTKADAVGKYCDYWWLVLEDLKIIDTLVVPATWGVLYPKSGVLRVHKKAPKREDAKPVTPAFIAAMIRKVVDAWVPKDVHEKFKTEARDVVRKELEQERKYAKDAGQLELNRLRDLVERFEKSTGLALCDKYEDGDGGHTLSPKWNVGNIAEAVGVVMKAREISKTFHFGDDSVVGLVEQELSQVEMSIHRHETALANRKHSAKNLRDMIARLKQEAGEQLELPTGTGR